MSETPVKLGKQHIEQQERFAREAAIAAAERLFIDVACRYVDHPTHEAFLSLYDARENLREAKGEA